MIELTEETVRLIKAVIQPSDHQRIEARLIEETSNMAGFCVQTPEGMERIRFSILRLICQDPSCENGVFELAKTDPRDLFMAADHGNEADAHLKWAESILSSFD